MKHAKPIEQMNIYEKLQNILGFDESAGLFRKGRASRELPERGSPPETSELIRQSHVFSLHFSKTLSQKM